jgi:hypothetical protein
VCQTQAYIPTLSGNKGKKYVGSLGHFTTASFMIYIPPGIEKWQVAMMGEPNHVCGILAGKPLGKFQRSIK